MNRKTLDKLWNELDNEIHNTCPRELIDQYKKSILNMDGLTEIIEPVIQYMLKTYQEDYPPEEKCNCPRIHIPPKRKRENNND
jgi:hypothetical protein